MRFRFPGIADWYIIRNFLGTFAVAISLIIGITIVFDISEKLDGFLGKYGKAPTLNEIVLDYYLNFIPYFITLFSPLFVFISVIYFTSRLAYRYEIIALHTAGWSFTRLLVPYLAAAMLLASGIFLVSNYVIPHANQTRIKFERTYLKRQNLSTPNTHQKVSDTEYVYCERFDFEGKKAVRFSYERIENGQLTYRLLCDEARYDSLAGVWHLYRYMAGKTGEKGWRKGAVMDTIFPFNHEIFRVDLKVVELMSNRELSNFIEAERKKGSAFLPYYEVESHSRTANPMAAIILTLIAVPIASRKMRGGIGIQLAFGISLAFAYVFIQKVTNSFAISGGIPPWLGVWLPNFIFGGIGIILSKFAQR